MEGLGARVRALRRRSGVTQARLAEKIGISASYLNLIEHGHRPLPAPLLVKAAVALGVDLAAFDQGVDESLVHDLLESFSDPLFEGFDLKAPDVRHLVTTHPEIARAVLAVYDGYRRRRVAQEEGAVEGDEAGFDDLSPSEEVTAFLQHHGNHFPALEEAAERVWSVRRFDAQNLYRGVVRTLMEVHGVLVTLVPELPGGFIRTFDGKRVRLSEDLPSATRDFQLAHQLALLGQSPLLDRLVQDPLLTGPTSRALGRIVLANYFAAALLMPYAPFLDSANHLAYDVERLGHRFRVGFEQVCHRLTTLRRPGAEGVPFHMLRVDIAGNISKRFSASGMRFARFSGACPRWGVYAAFLTPGAIRVQLSEMEGGQRYFAVSRTILRHTGGFGAPTSLHAIEIGCPLEQASKLVYARGLDLGAAPVPVGVSCRTCTRSDCDQRAFPAVASPLRLDENARGRTVFQAGMGPEP